MTTAESADQRRARRILAVDEAYQTLNEYHIDRRRVVFIANDEKRQGRLRDLVAVKEISLSGMHEASDLKRAFTKEVLVWSRAMGHPCVAKFLGFCADIAMGTAFDTVDVLAFLHQLDPPVCHGDLKSPNVLVNLECRAVLCDFGLARLYEDSGFRRLESTSAVKGSIRWWQSRIIMTGELPYGEAVADYVIMRKIFEGPLPQARGESRLGECLQLWDLMKRCWSANTLQRPTSAMCKTTFDYLPHCLPTPKTADLHARSAVLMENLGDLESWKANYKAECAYLEQALHLYEEEKNDKGIASVLRKQARAFSDSNRVESVNAASAALEKCRTLKDDIGVADAIYWMGHAEPKMVDSVRNMEESLKIFRTKENSVGIAKCLRYLGELYRQQGRYAKALSTLEEPVDVASRSVDRVAEVDALTLLGATHKTFNHMDKAISAYQKAHDIARTIGWEPGLSTCLCRLGNAKLVKGIHAEAEVLLRESVRVARNSDAGWRLGQALRQLGKCFQEQGRHEEAISALEESCSVSQGISSSFSWELAQAAALLADSKSALNHKEDAIAWYDTAMAEWRKGGDKWNGKPSKCLAAKDAILADMKRRDEGGLHGEVYS
ncbi:hypothetical protein M407DRAFT_25887 [Tulasnella calospora MUT 4182]|uniref:Tetratricopeptide repeat protein 29 n=1 Tax=Tulasnella calospora MUT 4182 TaxID=1051891 RepID=A0A0C3Q659_9AGAM|nr:hypothetical protein M407DRAFT_25887 [Tulasnella calospora MUT 4182]